MGYEGQGRRHDLLWAACIVAGFGIVLALIAVMMNGGTSASRSPEQTLAEARNIVAAGDQASTEEVQDYIAAREDYQRALDLLLLLEDAHPDFKAQVNLKIARTFFDEGNYRQAQQRIDYVQRNFPNCAAEEAADLEQKIRAKLAEESPPAPSSDHP
jgi:tetratricopeptide (TPR) repeat protein